MAMGCSGDWTIEVDESPEGDKWWCDIDSPHAYVTFPIPDPKTISAALRFLENAEPDKSGDDLAISVGRFGTASVKLVRDNEDFPRFFLAVSNPRARGTFRLTLQDKDLEMFRDALRQVVSELSD